MGACAFSQHRHDSISKAWTANGAGIASPWSGAGGREGQRRVDYRAGAWVSCATVAKTQDVDQGSRIYGCKFLFEIHLQIR
jgi:hypothetical protein